MTALPQLTTFARVPRFARGFVRDLRPRWAFEEVGQPYRVELIRDANTAEYRRRQPFAQVPVYRDDEVELFESAAIVLRIAERAGRLLPALPGPWMRAVQWVAAALNSVEPAITDIARNDIFEADRPWSRERGPVVRETAGRQLRGLEQWLDGRTWLEDEEFTVGDLMMVSVLGGLRKTDVLDRFPATAAYVARGEQRPAHVRAMAAQLALYADADATAAAAGASV